MLAEGRSTDLPDLKPGATYDVVLPRPLGAVGYTVKSIRCGRPVHLQLLVLLFDENLRPGTLALRVGTLTMEPGGVMMRSRRFRYLLPDGRVEAEGSVLHSRTSLDALTRRVREDVCSS